MLAIIRDKATGWIAAVIIGLLVISFAFWGVSFYSGQAGELNVAKVNDVDISFQSFQRSFSQLRKQMQPLLDYWPSVGKRRINLTILNSLVPPNTPQIPHIPTHPTPRAGGWVGPLVWGGLGYM